MLCTVSPRARSNSTAGVTSAAGSSGSLTGAPGGEEGADGTEVEAVAGPGVEPGQGREPVAADERPAPFEPAAGHPAEPLDRERCDVRADAEQPAFGAGGDERLDAFLPAGEPDAAAA